MISLTDLGVTANLTLFDARRNMELILDALLNGPSDNIAVDVRGTILLAPFNGEDTLDGGDPGFNLSRAIKCLTFDYGASFATHPLAGTNIELRNFQIEADEKAFLFETIEPTTRVNVTDLFNSIVSVCWFGAEARPENNRIDCHSAFVAAIDCFRRSPDTVSNQWNFIVRIPASIGLTSLYYLNEPLVIRSSVTLLGDGNLKSYIRFVNSSGITVAGFQVGNTTGQFCTISNLNISTLYTNPFVSTLNRHGIIANMTCYIENVTIRDFDGDGIHFVTSNNTGTGNLSKITNVNCFGNLRNGIYIDGDDSNNVLFQHISVRDNWACGIRENYSLLNTYINCNAENNSRQVGNISRVSFEISTNIFRRYVCHTDTPPNNTINPNLDPTHWFDIGPGAPDNIYTEFNINVNYISGLAYRVIYPSSKSQFLNCYAEDDGSLKKGVFGSFGVASGGVIVNINSLATVLGGTLANEFVRGSLHKSGGGYYSQAFGVKDTDGDLSLPQYVLAAPKTGVGEGTPQYGGFNTQVKVGNENYNLNYQFYKHHPMFGFNTGNTYAFKGNPINFIIKATLDDNSVKNWYGSGRTFPDTSFCFSSFQMPFFIREIGAYKFRLFGFSAQNPQNLPAIEGIKFNEDDFVLNSNSSSSNKAIGWRCIGNPNPPTLPNGTWETIHYIQPAAASANTANPTDPEVLAVLTELRDLKAKMRTAGMLEV